LSNLDFTTRLKGIAAAGLLGVACAGAKPFVLLTSAGRDIAEVEKRLKALDRNTSIAKLEKKLAKAKDPKAPAAQRLGLKAQKLKLEARSDQLEAAYPRLTKVASGLSRVAGAAEKAAPLLRAVASAASTVGGLAVAGAKMALDALVFKQNTQFAMKYSLGSAEKAATSYRYAQNIARVLGESASGMADEIQSLIREGFGAGDAETIVQLGADLKAMNGGKEVQMAGLTSVLKSLQKQGKFDAGSLDTLLAALPAQGQFGGKAVEVLAAKLGVNEKDARLREQKVRAALGGNKLRGQAGVDALFETVLAVSGEKKIGAAAETFSTRTVDGSLKRVKSSFLNLFDSLDTSDAGSSLVTVLHEVEAALDPASESGFALRSALREGAASAAKLLKGVDTKTLAKGLTLAADGARSLFGALSSLGGGVLQGLSEAGSTVFDITSALRAGDGGGGTNLANSLKNIGIAAGYLIVGVGTAIGGLVFLGSKILEVAAFVGKTAANIGDALITGIMVGLVNGKGRLIATIVETGEGIARAMRDKLKINSPSKVFAEIGSGVVEGFNLGIDRDAPEAEARMRAIATPQAGRGGGGAQRAVAAGPVTINIYATGSNAREIADDAVMKMVDALEQLGLASGAVGAPA
jgi:hypothetical protein